MNLADLVQPPPLSMLAQYFESVVPENDADLGLRTAAQTATSAVAERYEKLDFSGALSEVFSVVAQANRVIEEQKPWAKIKAGDRESVAALLRELLAVCQWCALTLSPIMPRSSQRLLELLNLPSDLTWENAADFKTLLTPGHCCQAPSALFPRIKNLEEIIAKMTSELSVETVAETAVPAVPESTPAVVAVEEKAEAPTIEYDDFAKIDLRIGKVLEAERVPKADKLLRLQVDLGTEQRQILAGIAQQFEPETLVGKSVVVVANLAPRKLRGFESQGMILAASTPDGPPLGLITIDDHVAPGSVVK